MSLNFLNNSKNRDNKTEKEQQSKEKQENYRKKVEELKTELEEEKQKRKKLEHSVGRLATVIKANAEGDLNEIPDEPEIEEAERIYKAYKNLLKQWRDSINKMESFSNQVGAASKQTDKKIEKVKNASRDVTEAIDSISKGADNQNQQIQNISSELNNLSSRVQEIAASADQAAELSSQASERGSSAQKTASEVKNELENLTTQADRAANNVEKLNQSISKVEEVVEVINDIADKTNILALNANVEASRAGEAGEGFAVVADEVKDLANDTKEATKEIEQSIREIHDQAAESVGQMQETSDTVDTTQEVVESTLGELDSIVNQVEDVNNNIQKIDDATDEQAESADQVVSSIEQVGDISSRTAKQANEVAEAASNQTIELSEVSTRAATLSDRAESLESTLKKYDVSNEDISNQEGTVIEFWHAMGGQKAILLEELVEEFESKHKEINIKLSSRGSYRGTLESTLKAAEKGNPPAIAQIYEVGTTKARESGNFIPVEKLLPETHLNNLVNQVKTYYQFDGKQYSLPFNSSNPVLAYNKEAFEKAGLDPENPPETFEEVKKAAQKIKSKNITEYGITFANYSWFVEQWFSEADENLVNNDNGRTGNPTNTNLDGKFAKKLFKWWKGMEEDGLYVDPGIEDRGNAKNKFHEKEAAMLIGSTSSLKSIESGADFQVGVGMLPVLDKRTGVLVGGASLWASEDMSEEVHEATGKFLKWLTQPEQQKRWHKETGYFPVHEDAPKQLKSEGWFEENPIYEVPFKQLEETENTTATRGAQIGPFNLIRTIIEDNIDSMDERNDVERTLNRLDSQITKKLESYNSKK